MKQFIYTALLTLTMTLNPAQAEEKDLRNTFAVVWNYVTTDQELINANVADQAADTLALWKQGIIENVYMNPEARLSDSKKATNVVYFIKAKDRAAADEMLAEQTFVKKQIAEYLLFPVGFLWLKTHEDKPEEK